jgi:undecaprenyl-diphosphatase
MSLLRVILLAVIQGLTELLPVSSSAHVVVAEKLMGLDPSSPQMTLLLVMLHTGTMFAVIVYFWKTWKRVYFSSSAALLRLVRFLVFGTALTGLIGLAFKTLLEETLFLGAETSELEQLFSHLELIAPALAAAGVLILVAGLVERHRVKQYDYTGTLKADENTLTLRHALWMGFVQGIAVPFRGFSRSGATISVAMLAGADKEPAERLSFALAVVLTPPAIAVELNRLLKAVHASPGSIDLHASLLNGALGAVFSFIAGLLALKWLSRWLESGRWYWFGIYCLIASVAVLYLRLHGF